MSVSKTPVYKDAAFQWAVRNLEDSKWNSNFVLGLLDFDVGDFGDFPVPENMVAGNLKAQVEAMQVKVGDLTNIVHHDPSVAFGLLVDDLPKPYFGLNGTYKFISEYWNEIFQKTKTDKDFNNIRDGVFTYGFLAAHHTKSDIEQRTNDLTNHCNKTLDGPKAFVKYLWKLKSLGAAFRTKKEERDAEIIKRKLVALKRDDVWRLEGSEVYIKKGGLIVVPKHKKYCFVLLQNEIDRIDKIVSGFGLARFVPTQQATFEKSQIEEYERAIIKWQESARKAFDDCDQEGANYICRAFDVIYHTHIAQVAQDISPRALEEQYRKWDNERLGRFVKRNLVNNSVHNMPIKEKLEVLLQYKALPAADFDFYSAAHRQKTLYENCNIKNQNTCNGNEFQEIMLYHKWLMLISFSEVHKKLPGRIKEGIEDKDWHVRYPYLKAHEIPFRDMDDIDFSGDFHWSERTTDVFDYVKDKAICPLKIYDIRNAKELTTMKSELKNQLLDWVSRTEPPNLNDLWNDLDNVFMDVKAEDKAEAKKPNGRWFFEAHTDVRFLLSQYEDSVSGYVKKCPGSVNGKTRSEITAKMNRLTAIPFSRAFELPVFISFDLEKFSPTLKLQIHQALDKQWAEAFGKPYLERASEIFTRGSIHYVKGPIHHHFEKLGNDFEGFFGRKNTMFHCAVMGYCIRRLREANLITTGCEFACLIDDGALRINVKKDQLQAILPRILTMIERIYNGVSLFISWDKTYVSTKLVTFLNNVYFFGHEIQPSLRSILKITSKSDAIVPSLLDEIAMLDSTSRGAVTSGALLGVTYAIYAWHLADLCRKWGPKDKQFNRLNIPKLFAPLEIGGLGISTPLLLSGSLGVNRVQENLGVLHMLAIRIPTLRRQIDQLINKKYEGLTVHERCQEPLKIRTDVRSLRATRVKNLIIRSLSKVVTSPVLRELLTLVQNRCATILDQMVESGAIIPVEIMESINTSDPVHAFSELANKFIKSRTAQSFLPRRALTRIVFAHLSEASLVLKAILM